MAGERGEGAAAVMADLAGEGGRRAAAVMVGLAVGEGGGLGAKEVVVWERRGAVDHVEGGGMIWEMAATLAAGD